MSGTALGASAPPWRPAVGGRDRADGYRIIVNVGDQQSDLDGGFAQRAFKLPNPFYFIPD
ncbi:MAG TPA: HAD family acid phosphatase [Solirubrobacteraceae bacterium]|jgi:hypothetical protein|nr:HAD family acid phosphatase [Solirubrobacteraceae bacterium]